MSIAVVCPGCSAKLNVPDGAADKHVKCPKCQGLIVVPEPLPEVPAFEVVDEPEPPRKKPVTKVKADVLLDDEDEKPHKKPVTVAQLDGDDDDDEDDRPRKKKQAAGNSAMVRNIIGVAVLIPLLGVAGYVFYDRYQKNKETTEANNAAASNSDDGGSVDNAKIAKVEQIIDEMTDTAKSIPDVLKTISNDETALIAAKKVRGEDRTNPKARGGGQGSRPAHG